MDDEIFDFEETSLLLARISEEKRFSHFGMLWILIHAAYYYSIEELSNPLLMNVYFKAIDGEIALDDKLYEQMKEVTFKTALRELATYIDRIEEILTEALYAPNCCNSFAIQPECYAYGIDLNSFHYEMLYEFLRGDDEDE